ncbi:MAG: hypothetical protein ACSHYB_14360 [Roseibacillus sp.]
MKIILILTPLFALTSCALVTTPLKVAGSAAGAAINITGKAVGAGVSHLGKDKSE